jgi:hypothetical protein
MACRKTVWGVEDACRGLLAAHAFVCLYSKYDRDAVRAHHLDHACDAFAVGDRGELVDDQQHSLLRLLARGEVLLEVLDEESAELAGLLAVEQLVEQQVAAVGVLEGPAAVELARSGVEESGVPLSAGVDMLDLERHDLCGELMARPELAQRVPFEPPG